MKDSQTKRTTPAPMRSVAALVGGAAVVALTAIALGDAPSTVSASRAHHGNNTEYTSPTQTAMKLGLTTVESTEQAPTTPPPVPATAFAAPRIKAG